MVLARQASTSYRERPPICPIAGAGDQRWHHRLLQSQFLPERTREEVEQAKTFKVPLSLVMINMISFIYTNEIHGHAEGGQGTC